VPLSQENVEIVRRFFDAFNRRDFDAALKDAAPDCEVDNSSNLGEWRGVHRGHDQIRQLWRSFLEPWESVRNEIDEVIDAGDRVVTCQTGHLRGRGGIEVTTKTSSMDVPRRSGHARRSFQRAGRSLRSRRASGVGDVAGERGDRAAVYRCDQPP
jgi:ketosteroid isomerase-like protein